MTLLSGLSPVGYVSSAASLVMHANWDCPRSIAVQQCPLRSLALISPFPPLPLWCFSSQDFGLEQFFGIAPAPSFVVGLSIYPLRIRLGANIVILASETSKSPPLPSEKV